MQCASAGFELFAGYSHTSLYLIRLTLSAPIEAHEAERRYLRPIVMACVTQGLAFKDAIENISREHIAGNEILFSDRTAETLGGNSKAGATSRCL